MPSLRPKDGELSSSQRSHDTNKGITTYISSKYRTHINSHDYLQRDFSRDIKNKGNYSQMIFMLKIRRVLNSIMDLRYNLPPSKPYSNQLQDVINITSHPQVPIWDSGTKAEHKIWTRVWEELVLLKMLMKIGILKMRGLLVMMMVSISPSGRDVPPAESLRRRAKVLLPKFRLKTAALDLESPCLIFF